MQLDLDNWRVQVKKGYLEMCLLLVIRKNKRMYGLELLGALTDLELSLKEGTLYPLLNRMTDSDARYAVVVPESSQRAALRVPRRVRDLLGIDVFVVAASGAVARVDAEVAGTP